MFCRKKCSWKFRRFHRKAPLLESLFNKDAALQACHFINKNSNTGILLWNFRNFYKHLFWRTSANDCFWPLTSAQIFQVSYPPYFYEAALFKEVDDDASKATIANGLVTFHLLKKQSEIWGQLHSRYGKDRYRRQISPLDSIFVLIWPIYNI